MRCKFCGSEDVEKDPMDQVLTCDACGADERPLPVNRFVTTDDLEEWRNAR